MAKEPHSAPRVFQHFLTLCLLLGVVLAQKIDPPQGIMHGHHPGLNFIDALAHNSWHRGYPESGLGVDRHKKNDLCKEAGFIPDDSGVGLTFWVLRH